MIREYTLEDRKGMEECIFELQEEEYSRKPEYWATPEQASKPYFDYLVNSVKEQPGNIFVAEENGEIAGMIAVRIETDSPCVAMRSYAYVPDMIVRKKFRGGGIGKQLMAKAEEYARAQGVTSIQLHVSVGNSAHEFYEHQGFQDDVQSIRMEKKL